MIYIPKIKVDKYYCRKKQETALNGVCIMYRNDDDDTFERERGNLNQPQWY